MSDITPLELLVHYETRLGLAADAADGVGCAVRQCAAELELSWTGAAARRFCERLHEALAALEQAQTALAEARALLTEQQNSI